MDGRANTTVGNSAIPDQRRAVLICRAPLFGRWLRGGGAAGALRAPKRLSKALTMAEAGPLHSDPA